MFGLLDYVKIGAGFAVGIVLMLGFNLLIHDPSIRREARQGYVLKAQKIALEAKLAERDRQIKAGQLVIESYQEQLRNARRAEQERIEQTEQEIADYEKKLAAAGRSCLLNSDDIEWMRK